MKKYLFSIFAFLVGIFTRPKQVFAEGVGDPNTWLTSIDLSKVSPGGEIATLMKARNWAEAGSILVPAFLSLTFFIAILLCLFLLVRGGFLFIFAEGEKNNLTKARTALVQAMIGLVLVFSVFLIFNLVQLILGVNLTGNKLFGLYGTTAGNYGICGKQYCP